MLLAESYWKAEQFIFRMSSRIPNMPDVETAKAWRVSEVLGVPLLRDSTTIGVFGLGRRAAELTLHR